METQESNTLIAEFMQVPFTTETGWPSGTPRKVFDFSEWPTHIDEGTGSLSCICEEELAFHESWDWLMPVVEKIVSMNTSFNLFISGGTHEYWNAEFVTHGAWPDKSPIKALYAAVIDFIEEWNEIDNQKKRHKSSSR